MRVLLVANAIGALGITQGLTAGITHSVINTANELSKRHHQVAILASNQSNYQGKEKLIGITGNYQPTIVSTPDIKDNHPYPIIPDALIVNYWRYIQQHQDEYDVIINFCHDWLPFYMTFFINTPILHQVNVCDESGVITQEIQKVAKAFPSRISVISHTQANELGIGENSFFTSLGIDVSSYLYNPTATAGKLAWCARICKEKGLEDAAEIAKRTNKKLVVCGYVQDQLYFNAVCAKYSDTIEYQGFVSPTELKNVIAQAEAFLCTHHWVEAFGFVVIEALACGTPVITYNRGGPAEIIEHGKTGFVTLPDDIDDAVAHVQKIGQIKRQHCRKACEQNYSLEAYGQRIEQWIVQAVHSPR